MKTKICTKCKEEKELNKFSKHSGHKDGFHTQCKKCSKEIKKEYYIRNKEKIKAKYRKHYKENSEQKKAYQKQYRLENLLKINLDKHQYAIDNKEKIADYQKEYRENNKIRRNKQLTEKYHTDINHKIKVNLRNRINAVLKGIYKSKRTLDLLGCSIEKLKSHLESLFEPDMNWNNCGLNGWEIDHIKPCASFDLTKSKQQHICFHYKNLQPLWAKENRSKADKILN